MLQQKPKRPNQAVEKKRFRWSHEMQENLLAVLNQIKTEYEFKGLDFESDLVRLYSEARVGMAKLYINGPFGPTEEQTIPEGVDAEEMKELKAKKEEAKKAIKQGYERIKQKVKDIRQDYRKAVTEGRRSGSGKLVCENWDTLKVIWGGSPATPTLPNSISSLNPEEEDLEEEEFLSLPGYQPQIEEHSDPDTDEEKNEEEEEVEEVAGAVELSQSLGESNDKSKENATSKEKTKEKPKNQFVDNKRKLLEKQLSANQRDQLYLNLAKDEYIMKQKMVNELSEATKESNKAFSEISKSTE